MIDKRLPLPSSYKVARRQITQTCSRCGIEATGPAVSHTTPNLMGWATLITYRLLSSEPRKRQDINTHICPTCADALSSFIVGDL
jgi:hypothetical protein